MTELLAPASPGRSTSGEHAAGRLAALDGLRAISILLVLAAHLLPLGPRPLQLNYAAGLMGMSLFFALSGFLIASRLLRSQDIIDFLVRRGARILPLFYLYIVLVFIFYDPDVRRLLWSAAFVINYKTQYLGGITGHLWSLCVEMQFYLAIAVAVVLLGSRGVWLVWPACLGVTLMRIEAGEYASIATHLRADEILAGSCAACIYHAIGRKDLSVPAVALPLAAVLWTLCSLSQTGPLQHARPYAAALVLMAAIWTGPGVITTALASRPARYVAEISYALYIVHPATAFGWMNEGSVATRYLVKRPVSFFLTFFLAHLSTFYWEKLWTAWAKGWLARRKSAGRATKP